MATLPSTDDFQRLETRELMRLLSALAHQAGVGSPARDYYEERWGPKTANMTASLVLKAFDWVEKAATTAGTTTDATWAGPLVTTRVSTGFLTSVRRASVIGKLPVTTVPFGVQMTTLSSGSSTGWVGEGVPKPTSKMAFANQPALKPFKASSIVVVTRELMQVGADGSEEALATILRNEVVTFSDTWFLGTSAATANNPAGLLNGVTPSADLAATVAAFFTARPYAATPTWVVSPAKLGAMSATDTNVPRTYRGLPIVTTPAAGTNAILLDPSGVAVADGGITLDVSNQAALELVDAPTNPPVAATVVQSLWQMNLSAIRCERFLNWVKDGAAVQYTVVA